MRSSLTLNLPQIDAVQQGRGIPDAVRRLHCSLFSKLRVTLDTRSGPSQPLAVTRGVPQGAVSSPELSRTAQDPLLRLRACDGAAYTTSAGRSVPAAGYVDDIEHYGDGLRDLPAILHSLALGSSATGVGFAWSKFSAFATDWDETLPHLQHRPERRRRVRIQLEHLGRRRAALQPPPLPSRSSRRPTR